MWKMGPILDAPTVLGELARSTSKLSLKGRRRCRANSSRVRSTGGSLRPAKSARVRIVALGRRLYSENVVEFERLVDLCEPFGPVGCAAAAALIERQFQLAQQAGDLLARGHVA